MKSKILSILLVASLPVLSQNTEKKYFTKRYASKSENVSASVSPLYAFSTFTSPYNSISGTTVTGGQKWDDTSYPIPIGFTFTLYTQSSNSLYIGVGGQFISFNDPDNDPYVSLAAPMFEDICDRAYMPTTDSEGDPGGISPISYTTIGTPGSRICKIEVRNAGFYGENDAYSMSTSFVNFQVWLYETSNRIEFRYGNLNIQNPVDNLMNGTTGFVTGLADSVDVNTGDSPSSNMLDGPYANPAVVPWTNMISTFVAGAVDSGRVYRFDRLVSASIKTNDFKEIVRVYPNPASDKLVIKGIDLKNASISLHDVNGKNVSYVGSVQNNTIDVSELKNGIYFLKVETGTGLVTKKIVIAK